MIHISQMALTVKVNMTRLLVSEVSPLWVLILTEILGSKACSRTVLASPGLVKCLTVLPNGCLDGLLASWMAG